MQLTSLLASVLALVSITSAAPTATEKELVARSFQSGGQTCYYKCANVVNGDAFVSKQYLDQFGAVTTVPSDNVRCNYAGGTYCEHHTDDGSRYAGSTNRCTRAAFDGCGTPGSPDQAFKKRHMSKKRMTPAQQLIASRQYKPKSAERK